MLFDSTSFRKTDPFLQPFGVKAELFPFFLPVTWSRYWSDQYFVPPSVAKQEMPINVSTASLGTEKPRLLSHVTSLSSRGVEY